MIIWLTVPLSLIGVTAGFLIFNQPIGSMSLLGLMRLSGGKSHKGGHTLTYMNKTSG